VIYQSILSAAPLRVSFVGGGTDISSFYTKFGGEVISASINKYVYVHIKRHDPLFQEKFRISYSEVEHTNSRDSIKNDIVRSCLEFLDFDEPLQISTSSDLPSNSGLGSSSSFCVALLSGLHAIRGEDVSAAQLAEEACFIEIDLLKGSIGKQDQYAAAIGGFNHYIFGRDGKVTIAPITSSNHFIDEFFRHSILVWTGLARNASTILKEQDTRSKSNEGNLLELKTLVSEFLSVAQSNEVDLQQSSRIMQKGWELKKSFASSIVTPEILEIENALNLAGASGYKLLGAGGGGFILSTFTNLPNLNESFLPDWSKFKPKIDNLGVRVVSRI
jgi:D-glycero-alpha-D-manno-heptose-7-phosphate kinase